MLSMVGLEVGNAKKILKIKCLKTYPSAALYVEIQIMDIRQLYCLCFCIRHHTFINNPVPSHQYNTHQKYQFVPPFLSL